MTSRAVLMLNKLIAALAAVLAFFGINILNAGRNKRHGKAEAELEQAQDELEAVDEANRIRDRLESDPEYADRVRERFTRR